MSQDEQQQGEGTRQANDGASGRVRVGTDVPVLSRLPAPPNARVDGLDTHAARLAAFVAREIDVPDSGAGTKNRGAGILAAARVRGARRRRAGAGVALGALATVGFVAWTVVSRPAPALSYTIDGAAPSPGGYVHSSGAGHETDLAFSDGTHVRVLPSARARVVDVGTRGARLMLENGRAHVQVAHRPGADWQIQAGAYVIHVHGTAFVVDWDASQARLDVRMESGVVSVDGPRPGDTLVLRAGEALSVRSNGSRVVTTTPPPVASSGPAPVGPTIAPRALPAAAPPEPKAGVEAALPPSRRIAVSAPPAVPWSERLADGEAAAILVEAQRRGIASVLAGASSEDLAALADAARFRKRDELARRVLLAQRRRFPGTLRAEEASFLLGRLAEDSGGRATDALGWYERYLLDAPSGGYAAEAMGRMMLALDRQQRTEEARTVAAGYLRRFPHGAYARAARGIARTDR